MNEASYSCFKCGYVTNEAATVCPQCGSKRFFSTRSMRVRGWLQLVIGLFLVGLMGTITYRLAPSLLLPGASTDGSRFTGTVEQARLILGLFGLVIIFGFFSMLSGVWQIVTARRNKWIFYFMMALIALVISMAWYTTRSIGGNT